MHLRRFGLSEGANLPGKADHTRRTARCNGCTPPTHLIRHETQMRYRRHILLRRRPVRPLSQCAQ